jgi:hypothetical protein
MKAMWKDRNNEGKERRKKKYLKNHRKSTNEIEMKKKI